MQVIHDFGKAFLRFVLPGHVVKVDAFRGLDIDLRVALAHAEHHGVGASGLLRQFPAHILSQADEYQHGEHGREEDAQQRRCGLFDVFGKGGACIVEPLYQAWVLHDAGGVDGGIFLIREDDLGTVHLYPADVLFGGHFHKGAVIYFHDLSLHKQRSHDHVEEENDQHGDSVIVN